MRFKTILALLLLALLLVYTVVKQTMPDIIPLLRSGDEEALEAYLSRDMSFTGILYMALLQMVQVWSIVISGVIVNVAAGVVYGVWRAFAICLVSSSLAHGISFTLYQRLGKYLDKLLPDNSSDKLDIVAKSEHPAYMVVTLCFLPLIPNGFIPIAASRSRLKPWEFTLAMFFGSAFSTLVVLMLSIAFLLWKYQKQVLHLIGQLLEKRKQRNGNKNADLSESSRV